jgi:hypothetical protein
MKMKRTSLAVAALLVFGLFFSSCKREEAQPAVHSENKVAPAGTGSGTARLIQDCAYTKLTQTTTGIWEADFGATHLKFTNLHIKPDGKLYGRLLSAENYPIVTGGDGYNQRDFAFERPNCSSAGSGVTKSTRTLSYTEFTALSGGNGSYAYYNGLFSSFGAFSLWAQSNLTSGITYAVGTGTYIETRYDWVTNINCNGTQVVIGKLVAKGVVQQANGTFTSTEYGISNMCYPDPFVLLYPLVIN